MTKAHPILAEMLRTTKPGELLAPFQIEGWWLVVRLESYTPASFDTKTSQQMCEEQLTQWVNEETASRIRLLNDSKSQAAML